MIQAQGLLLVGIFLVAVEGFDYNSTVSFNGAKRFKRGAVPSNDKNYPKLEGRGPTNFGNLLENPRKVAEELCNWRLNGGRLTSTETNKILDLVLVQERKNGENVRFFEEFKGEFPEAKFKAYYYPYLYGNTIKDQQLNVGWVDIPKHPAANQPKIAITGHMNGCATVIMEFKDRNNPNMRVYHLQSPGTRYQEYIDNIRRYHPVNRIVASFGWEEYGFGENRFQGFIDKNRVTTGAGFVHETMIFLHYDTNARSWYYTSQMNLNKLTIQKPNSQDIILTNEDRAFNGKTYKTLYSKLRDTPRKPRLCQPLHEIVPTAHGGR